MTQPESPVGTAELAGREHRDEADWTPLFNEADARTFRDRWTAIQNGFVDAPRESVQQADALVADTMKRLATSFADERAQLERGWAQGGDVSTEDLRLALRRYRTFFDRLLSI